MNIFVSYQVIKEDFRVSSSYESTCVCWSIAESHENSFQIVVSMSRHVYLDTLPIQTENFLSCSPHESVCISGRMTESHKDVFEL